MSDVRFDSMHFMSYVHLPPNHKNTNRFAGSFPNKLYVPEKEEADVFELSPMPSPCPYLKALHSKESDEAVIEVR